MLFTSILITLSLSLLLYIILYSQINKIKKEYVKKDLTEEMKDIITVFTEEADKSITILENLINEADKKAKELKRLSKKMPEKITGKSEDKNNLKNQSYKNINNNSEENSDNEDINSIKNNVNNLKNNIKVDNNGKQNLIDNIKELNDNHVNKIVSFSPDTSWEELAYRLFENGFNVEEISLKLKKSVAEINFALKYIKLKKRLK